MEKISPARLLFNPAGESGNRDDLPVAEIVGIIQIIVKPDIVICLIICGHRNILIKV